jgi:hypothetical protein
MKKGMVNHVSHAEVEALAGVGRVTDFPGVLVRAYCGVPVSWAAL